VRPKILALAVRAVAAAAAFPLAALALDPGLA
jgi:hypothetical protein